MNIIHGGGGPFDIIIANDIFPDADQRLTLFIDSFLPICREMRLLITYYNTPRYYQTRRVDDSEILTFLSYDGAITAFYLEKYLDVMDATRGDLAFMKENHESIYYNGRQVCSVRLRGGLSGCR